MNSKKIIWLLSGVGGYLGGYVPLLWGGEYFSFSSILLGAVGAILGIWVGFKMTRF